MLPGLLGGRDDVDMAIQQQGRRGALPGDTRDEVRPGRVTREEQRLDPLGTQQSADIADTGGLVARRIGGIAADELLQQLDGTPVYRRLVAPR